MLLVSPGTEVNLCSKGSSVVLDPPGGTVFLGTPGTLVFLTGKSVKNSNTGVVLLVSPGTEVILAGSVVVLDPGGGVVFLVTPSIEVVLDVRFVLLVVLAGVVFLFLLVSFVVDRDVESIAEYTSLSVPLSFTKIRLTRRSVLLSLITIGSMCLNVPTSFTLMPTIHLLLHYSLAALPK